MTPLSVGVRPDLRCANAAAPQHSRKHELKRTGKGNQGTWKTGGLRWTQSPRSASTSAAATARRSTSRGFTPGSVS
ncbi:hypothetical protein GBP94_19910 [Mycobacterium avium subsp. hominissuis]|nr:hypothetical protein [Mycobacterium avium subsp. hominissuis]